MEFIRARWELAGGRGPGKPISPGGGGGKPGHEQKQPRNKPDMLHMTEVRPGDVGLTEGPDCKVGDTGGMARQRPGRGGWMAAFSSQSRKDPGGCLGERQMALWSMHFVGGTA